MRRYRGQLIGGGSEPIPCRPGFCACGCGRITKIAKRSRRWNGLSNVRGEPLPYWGDHRRDPALRTPLFVVGSNGRTYIRDRNGRRVYWYRIVARNLLGRELRPDEVVHHLNGDVTDDRPENLSVITRGDHARVHFASNPPPVEALA